MEACPDCQCSKGELHELFCTKERCAFCGGQLITCGCISKVLELDAEEQKALDEYIDDQEEPLQSINVRWAEALDRKGRVPF